MSVMPRRDAQEWAHAFPIVTLFGGLVAGGFVRSLAHPGGNITGVGNFVPGFNGSGKKSSRRERQDALGRVVIAPFARNAAVIPGVK